MSISKDLKKGNIELVNGENFLKIPNTLEGFVNTNTILEDDKYVFEGYINLKDDDCICKCGTKAHNHKYRQIVLKHVPFGANKTVLKITLIQFICPNCKKSFMQPVLFKEQKHLITIQLKRYIKDLQTTNNFTNKEINYLTGVDKNLVKEIDKERLQELYTVNGEGKELIKPVEYAQDLGIDEFKLHDGYKYATHIIDYSTGHILWIQEGKKKSVVYNFIDYVGLEWMSHVKAIACDMNSDFEEAFAEKCPNLKIVYDHFHIVKNFNEKVVGAIRKEEQARLISEGDEEAARRLKRTKFILTSNESTLIKKDEEALNDKVTKKGSELFKTSEIKAKGGKVDKYNKLINSNELFLIIALIKELLQEAYQADSEKEMARLLFDIMDLCETNGNKHLVWFKNLLYNHFEGIISYATYRISSGKIEGINNKIKTLRKQAYGYPDDEYFFLKLFDASRN